MYTGKNKNNMNENEGIDPERIQEIAQQSIPFPFFMSDSSDDGTIRHAVYVEEMGPNSPLFMPSFLTIVRETSDGWSTVGTYELVETFKEHTFINPSELN